MRSRYRMALWVGLGLVVAGYAPGAGAVTTNVWTNAAGGRFDVSGNWDPAGPPGSADTALFNAGGLLNRTVVTFSSDPSVTNKTANFTMARYNASNRWEFVIGDDAGPAVYDAGATILGGSYLYNADGASGFVGGF